MDSDAPQLKNYTNLGQVLLNGGDSEDPSLPIQERNRGSRLSNLNAAKHNLIEAGARLRKVSVCNMSRQHPKDSTFAYSK